jgi:hypothetical protein
MISQIGLGILADQPGSAQFGFITGTFIFALLTIADRFSPSLVFWKFNSSRGLRPGQWLCKSIGSK